LGNQRLNSTRVNSETRSHLIDSKRHMAISSTPIVARAINLSKMEII
jgi:hypothetical protein